MDNGELIIKTVGGAATAGVGLVGFWRKVIKPYLNKKNAEKNEWKEKILEIHAELKFNGGSSLKDAVFRLENGQKFILSELSDIRESQKLALNISGTAFWYSDKEGGCTYVSPGLEKIMGRGSSEILGNKWVSWILPEDKERIFDAWTFSVENQTIFDEQYTYKRSDGMYQKVWGLAFHKLVDNEHSGTLGKLEAIGEPYNL